MRRDSLSILIDTDNVKLDFTSGFLQIAHKVTGRAYAREHQTQYELTNLFTPEELRTIWSEIDRTPGFVTKLREFDGTRLLLRRLRQVGEVIALTAPRMGPHWMPERAQWLQDRGFKFDEIVFTHRKHSYHGDVFIDDYPNHSLGWKKRHPEGCAILWDAPYNRDVDCDDFGLKRASNWAEALAHVNEHARAVGAPTL
jgi:5'(3')-deoxyribonucleotidase